MDTTDDLVRQIAAEVKAAMTVAGISQRDLAESTQIPLVTLSRRLTGAGRAFDLSELAAIAEALDVTVTDLVVSAERSLGIAS